MAHCEPNKLLILAVTGTQSKAENVEMSNTGKNTSKAAEVVAKLQVNYLLCNRCMKPLSMKPLKSNTGLM